MFDQVTFAAPPSRLNRVIVPCPSITVSQPKSLAIVRSVGPNNYPGGPRPNKVAGLRDDPWSQDSGNYQWAKFGRLGLPGISIGKDFLQFLRGVCYKQMEDYQSLVGVSPKRDIKKTQSPE